MEIDTKSNLTNSGQISVIIPVYNAESFLDKSVNSVISQSYKNIEIILINDGSIDNSLAICDKFVASDKRVKIISQTNSGPAAARNRGISHASGELVFFLDADDFIADNAFEILMNNYNQYRPDLIMSNFSKLENSGNIINQDVSFCDGEKPFTDDIKMLDQLDIQNYIRHFLRHPSNHLVSYCWARLYKLSIIKDNGIIANESMRLFEDLVFNLEYLKHVDKMLFVNKNFYIYVMHNSHTSASMSIVNADSLLHDMAVFKTKISEFFQIKNSNVEASKIEEEIGHALIHYVIIFVIRSCRYFSKQTKKRIYIEISKIINASIFRTALPYYSPSKGNSRILPFLAKFKLVSFIIYYCKNKAYKRYGKPEIIN